MQHTFFLILTFFSLTLFGQEVTKEVGDVEVQLIQHQFKRNKNYDLTKSKTNRKNRPHTKLFFSSDGMLLKKIGFGKHHNTDLRLTDYIVLYNYADGKVVEEVKYESDYQKNIYPYWRTKYTYNKNGQLIDESVYNFETDSLFMRTTYEYDSAFNRVKIIQSPSYYIQREYDSSGRVKALRQIYDNKLRWAWNYHYTDSSRIGLFQTHYLDGTDYSKKEIKLEQNKKLSEIEEKHLDKDGLNIKVRVYYHDSGIIKRIEYYEANSRSSDYKLVSYTDVKVKSEKEVSEESIRLINETIEIK